MNIGRFLATIIESTSLLVVMPVLALSQISHQNLRFEYESLDLESGTVHSQYYAEMSQRGHW